MNVTLDVIHGEQKTAVTVKVKDGLQGLRLMNAAEEEARKHADDHGWNVERIDFVRVVIDEE